VRNIPIEAGFPFEMPDLKTSLAEEYKNEVSESQNIYPSFARITKDEEFKEIAKSFSMIAAVESTLDKILEYLSSLYTSNKLYKRDKPTKWKCSSCGHIETSKEGFKQCPLCKLPQGYIIIDLEKELSL